MTKISIFALFVMGSASVFGQGTAPLITIPDGQLVGSASVTIRDKVPYYAYRGIPYAQTPKGNLRFADPVKNSPWTGILDATNDKDMCVQVRTDNGEVDGSEDCLHINVYTTNVTGSLPVMVWIYGGGFVFGSSSYSSYGPDYLLEKEVVYVAFNYRLGVFGFLSTEDTVASGNWGIKDQILALQWIQNNIQYFGGDPEKVTIFGESAGAASVSYLLQSNKTAGLYRAAIMESGTSLCSWSLTQDAKKKAFHVGVQLGITALTSETLIKKLRTVNYVELKLAEFVVTKNALITDNILAGLPFGVVTEPDYVGAVVTGKSWEKLANGNFEQVPVIIGHNSNEAGAAAPYIYELMPYILLYGLAVQRVAPSDLTNNWFKRLAAGIKVKDHFFEASDITTQPENLTRFLSMDLFVRPIRETASRISQISNTYYYQFSYEGSLVDANNTFPGVGHAEEVNYLFVRNETGSAADNNTISRFVTLWTNFAKTLNPTPPTSDTPLGSLVWNPNNPLTNSSSSIKYLNINDTLAMAINPFQIDWDFYEDLYSSYGEPPYTTY